MATLEMRLHPGVITGKTARQRGRSAQLGQGDVEGACGACTVLMALIVLGIASRSKLRSIGELEADDPLAGMWAQAQKTYFTGADEDEMRDLFKTLDRLVRYKETCGSKRRVLAFTLDRLEAGDVVVLGFSNKFGHGGHWVLAVGTESMVVGTKRTTTGVFCLDPSTQAPTVAPYNTKLDLMSPRRGARCLHYRLPSGGLSTVTCDVAFALSVRR